MKITYSHSLPDGLDHLISESESDGFKFVRRLADDYTSGKNRFSGEGEALFSVYDDGNLIGIGGINVDPFSRDEGSGRVRRLYVLRRNRSAGVGKMLMAAIEQHANKAFNVLNLFTDSEAAARFYEKLGYIRVSEEKRTHYKLLK